MFEGYTMKETSPKVEIGFLRVMIVLCLICGLGPFSTDMYLPSIPFIAEDLGTSVPTIQLTLSVFFFGLAIGQIFYGPLSDAFGRKIVLLIGVSVFLLSSVVSIFSYNFEMLFAMRLCQALGAASGMVIMNAIMRDLYEGYQFVKAVSVTMMTINIAPLIAPSIGGLIAPYGWRWCFVALSIFGSIVLLSLIFGIKETLAIENRQPIRFGVVINNYRKVLTNTKSLGALLAQTAHGAGMFAFISGSPFVYISIYGVSPSFYGLLFALNIVGVMILTAFNTLLVKKFGLLKTLFGALLFSCMAGILLVISASIRFESVYTVVIPIVMFISTIGIIGSNSTTYILGIFKEISGTASATLGSLRLAGGALAGFALNIYQAESPLPLAITMCSCGIIAFASFWLSRLFFKRNNAS